MDIGVIFPQTEVGGDRGAVRAIGQAAADLGYTHLAAYDHVLGGDTRGARGLGGPYTIDDTFREPLTMFAYLAGCTDLAFATSILIGPQRQTALLAKQAAEVDLLCGGRFRLGLGIGWNKLEYDALGVPFEQRAPSWRSRSPCSARCGPQRSVTVDGRFHHIRAAGLAPLPVQRPIPIWIGAFAPAALRRVGRVADGWFPMVRPGGGLERSARDHPRGRGRGWARPVRLRASRGGSSTPSATSTSWPSTPVAGARPGASHLSLNTMHAGLTGVDAHIDATPRRWPGPALTAARRGRHGMPT